MSQSIVLPFVLRSRAEVGLNLKSLKYIKPTKALLVLDGKQDSRIVSQRSLDPAWQALNPKKLLIF